jgi:hypothetical protein
VLTGQVDSTAARTSLVECIRAADADHGWELEDAHTRATVQPAIRALHALGLTDERLLSALRVREVAPDGAELRLRERTLPVPQHLRRALRRQRLHAQVIGQRPDDQLLTFDGSVARPSALAWY